MVHLKYKHIKRYLIVYVSVQFSTLREKEATQCLMSISIYVRFCLGSPSNLKRHVNVVHKKLKPYVCEICGGCFGTSSNLKRHVRVERERERRRLLLISIDTSTLIIDN